MSKDKEMGYLGLTLKKNAVTALIKLPDGREIKISFSQHKGVNQSALIFMAPKDIQIDRSDMKGFNVSK